VVRNRVACRCHLHVHSGSSFLPCCFVSGAWHGKRANVHGARDSYVGVAIVHRWRV
jgi:hypothetical protein